jgi:hypothetical protein
LAGHCFKKKQANDPSRSVSGLISNYRADLGLAVAPRVESMFKTGVIASTIKEAGYRGLPNFLLKT